MAASCCRDGGTTIRGRDLLIEPTESPQWTPDEVERSWNRGPEALGSYGRARGDTRLARCRVLRGFSSTG